MEKSTAPMMTADWIQVGFQSFVQAIATSIAVMSVAVLGAVGLIRVRSGRWRTVIEALMLLPSFLPAIFVIVAALNLFSLIEAPFPFGIPGIVFVNVLFMSGFMAVAAARVFDSELGGGSELAYVEGARPLDYWIAAIGAVKGRLMLLFSYVFITAFSAFAIPLIIGGPSGETVDVHIYKLAFAAGEWQTAVVLAAVQMAMLFGLSLLLSKERIVRRAEKLVRREWGFMPALIPAGLCVIAVIAGGLDGVITGFQQLVSHSALRAAVWSGLWGTMVQCIVAMSLFVIAFGVCLWMWPSSILLRALRGFAAPSTALFGLCVYLLWPDSLRSSDWTLVISGFGFLLLIFASVYRLRGEAVLTTFESQIQVARVLGASRAKIFFEVLWPQAKPEILWMTGLVGLWTAGDFAFSFIVLERERTLAIIAQTLLGGYRLELATAVVWLLMFVGTTLFFICSGWGNVYRKKLNP